MKYYIRRSMKTKNGFCEQVPTIRLYKQSINTNGRGGWDSLFYPYYRNNISKK